LGTFLDFQVTVHTHPQALSSTSAVIVDVEQSRRAHLKSLYEQAQALSDAGEYVRCIETRKTLLNQQHSLDYYRVLGLMLGANSSEDWNEANKLLHDA
jgi:hypothetical protein